MAQRFAGRVVAVTGASGGLGQAVVAAFLAEGARVAAIARDAGALAQLDRRVGDESLLTLPTDLLDPAAAGRAVGSILDWAGRLDVLVNAVGAYSGGALLAESTPEEWSRMLDTNLLTALHATRACLRPMLEQGGGRIINVSSRAARKVGTGVAAYTAAKAGLEALTLAAAEEYRERGITVNAVAPSVIATSAMLAQAGPRQRARWVPPASVAGVILFLASDAAVDVSGAIIPVYGRA